MRIAVVELPTEVVPRDASWTQLRHEISRHRPDLVLLNEMPFAPWLFGRPIAEPSLLSQSVKSHDTALEHIGELGASVVLGTRPAWDGARFINQAFVWDASGLHATVHTKQYFPEEPGYYESRWFGAGAERFGLDAILDIEVGFMICTDAMFLEHARMMGRRGASIIAVPRACGDSMLTEWRTVLSAAAVTSGCYVMSSNRVGTLPDGQVFGGRGWIFDPHGRLIAETTPEAPLACVLFEPGLVSSARSQYPCNVAG